MEGEIGSRHISFAVFAESGPFSHNFSCYSAGYLFFELIDPASLQLPPRSHSCRTGSVDTCSASPWAVCGTEEPQGRSTPLRRAGAGHGVWAGARRHLPARYLARGPCPHRSAQARPRQGAGGPGAPSGRGRVASPTAMSLPLRPCRPLLKAAGSGCRAALALSVSPHRRWP